MSKENLITKFDNFIFEEKFYAEDSFVEKCRDDISKIYSKYGLTIEDIDDGYNDGFAIDYNSDAYDGRLPKRISGIMNDILKQLNMLYKEWNSPYELGLLDKEENKESIEYWCFGKSPWIIEYKYKE